jgi:hypothetical protein
MQPSNEDVIKSIKALPTTGAESETDTSTTQLLVAMLMAATTVGFLAAMLRVRRGREEELERARVRVRSERNRR